MGDTDLLAEENARLKRKLEALEPVVEALDHLIEARKIYRTLSPAENRVVDVWRDIRASGVL